MFIRKRERDENKSVSQDQSWNSLLQVKSYSSWNSLLQVYFAVLLILKFLVPGKLFAPSSPETPCSRDTL